MRNPATLADAAEKWARARKLPVPARGTAAWQGMFNAWQRGGMSANAPGCSAPRVNPDLLIRSHPAAETVARLLRSWGWRADVVKRQGGGWTLSTNAVQAHVLEALRRTAIGLEQLPPTIKPAPPRRPNKAVSDRFSELQEDARAGAGVSGRTEPVLQALASAFEGGGAFTREQAAHEAAGILRGAQGQTLSHGSVSARVGHALSELERKGYVQRIGKALGATGRPGPQRFTLTLAAEQRAEAQRDADSFDFGENVVAKQIAALEAQGPPPTRSPLSGPVYRPSLPVLETKGHKVPKLQKERIKRAGYRCNPQIVLGRVEHEFVPEGTWRADLGERPKMRPVAVARVLMWKRDGIDSDIAKAETFAAANDYAVLTFDKKERDPLGKARAALLRVKNPDAELRALERSAAHGDPGTFLRYERELRRAGGERYRQHLLKVLRGIWSSRDFDFEQAERDRDNTDTLEDYVSDSRRFVNPSGRYSVTRHDPEKDTRAYIIFSSDNLAAAQREFKKARVPRFGSVEIYDGYTSFGHRFGHSTGAGRRGRNAPAPQGRALPLATCAVCGSLEDARKLQGGACPYCREIYGQQMPARLYNAPRSKLCRQGRHDFVPATGLCRRAGCDAFHHARQGTMFGRDLDPTAVREAAERERLTGQRDLFGRVVNPLTGPESAGVLAGARFDLSDASKHRGFMKGYRVGSAAGATSVVREFGAIGPEWRDAAQLAHEVDGVRAHEQHAALARRRNALTAYRDPGQGSPIVFATVSGKRDVALARRFGTDLGRGRFSFTRDGWAALVLEHEGHKGGRKANPAATGLSVLVLGNSPHGAPITTAPRAANRPVHERGSIPPAGTPGVELVRQHQQMFHGAPGRRWVAIDVEDGKPGVRHVALSALGLTEASVYSAPWRASNKHAGGVYEHVHETRKPLEAYDPVLNISQKFIEPGSGPSDWWRDDRDAQRALTRRTA